MQYPANAVFLAMPTASGSPSDLSASSSSDSRALDGDVMSDINGTFRAECLRVFYSLHIDPYQSPSVAKEASLLRAESCTDRWV